ADDGADKGDERYRYIGIDKDIMKLSQVHAVDGDVVLDDEFSLFTIKSRSHELPSTNRRLLVKTGDTFTRDDFVHEHYLVVASEGKHILISGCAHNGILSILDAYKEVYGAAPDMVVSGFHLMKKVDYTEDEIEEVRSIARELGNYDTKFVTCHCTGVPAYELMKEIMGEQLVYAHSGDEVEV
ncbi:MAG: MBL fold metallo-hydrolase, partial [Lachnospiraceae bacterium]|nr:MBL fold metallo-hydrolase [Lachnospiraceae bacterium]